MGKALSVDLRNRVVAAVEAGLSRRRAAERFGVSVASAIRWIRLSRSAGHVRPKPVGGDQRSRRIEGCAPMILAAVEAKSDITLAELRSLLAERGVAVAVAVSSLWRFFARRNITVKKNPRTWRSRTVPMY